MQGERESQPYERGEEEYLAFAIANAGVRAIADSAHDFDAASAEAGDD